jgi:hypothetical protein
MPDEINEVKVAEEPKKLREIIISTDGDIVNLVKAEVAGKLELKAILSTLLAFLDTPPKK